MVDYGASYLGFSTYHLLPVTLLSYNTFSKLEVRRLWPSPTMLYLGVLLCKQD